MAVGALVGASGVALAVLFAVVVTRDPRPSAARTLRDIQRFVAAAGTVRFEATHEHEAGTPTRGTGPQTAETEGVLALPDRARWRSRAMEEESERIETPEGAYSRWATIGNDLDDQRWIYSPETGLGVLDELTGTEDTGAAFLSVLVNSSGQSLVPTPGRTDLRRTLAALRAPERVDHDDPRSSPVACALRRDGTTGPDG